MKYVRAAVLVLCTLSLCSKLTVWTYKHFHSTAQVR